MPSPSKDKGKRGERELANILSNIFGEKFGRVFTSGAFYGGKNAKRLENPNKFQMVSSRGDIIPSESTSHIIFECKWYKETPWGNIILSNKNAKLESWIEQTKILKKSPEEIWFLCMKFNRQGWYVLFDYEYHKKYQYALGNYIFWYSDNTKEAYLITDMIKFFEDNKEKIIAKISIEA